MLPLALAGGSAVAPAGATTMFGGGWAERWLSTATGTTAGTSLKEVRTIIGADTGAAVIRSFTGVTCVCRLTAMSMPDRLRCIAGSVDTLRPAGTGIRSLGRVR